MRVHSGLIVSFVGCRRSSFDSVGTTAVGNSGALADASLSETPVGNGRCYNSQFNQAVHIGNDDVGACTGNIRS